VAYSQRAGSGVPTRVAPLVVLGAGSPEVAAPAGEPRRPTKGLGGV